MPIPKFDFLERILSSNQDDNTRICCLFTKSFQSSLNTCKKIIHTSFLDWKCCWKVLQKIPYFLYGLLHTVCLLKKIHFMINLKTMPLPLLSYILPSPNKLNKMVSGSCWMRDWCILGTLFMHSLHDYPRESWNRMITHNYKYPRNGKFYIN